MHHRHKNASVDRRQVLESRAAVPVNQSDPAKDKKTLHSFFKRVMSQAGLLNAGNGS